MRVEEIDWHAFPGPEYYDPDRAEEAFRSVISSGRGEGDPGAAIRWAVGNDHGGSLYPAAVPAARRLLEIIAAAPGRPRVIALGVLLDWWGMFGAEPGYEVFTDPDGASVELVPAIVAIAREARPVIAALADEDPGTRKQTRLLLKCIDAGWKVLDY